MGVFCDIDINKPDDENIRPGMVVSGVIRYTVDKETTLSKIIVSLKGIGRVVITQTRKSKDRTYEVTSSKSEHYVDIDNVITKENDFTLPIGSYMTTFGFQLPSNVPQSLRYSKHRVSDRVECEVQYYIRIKFDQPGWRFPKRFKKEFAVASNVIPRLPMKPVVCGHQKTLTQIFSLKKRMIDIKASIESCIIAPGGTIRFNCEVNNDTNLDIKAIKTKLVEVYSFYTSGTTEHFVHQEKIRFTDSKTSQIKSGKREHFDFNIDVPVNAGSIENTTIVKREYFVWIEAILPMPHRNAALKIEVQIGEMPREHINIENDDFGIHNDAPLSYWEAMNEVKKGVDP